MRAIHDPGHALAAGLERIREQFKVPAEFPPAVVAAAEQAATRKPTDHVDRTAQPFVTLDPATSTDLDQAFMIETSGTDLILHYAIADVAWFVNDGDPVDTEAWQRGTTVYLPDGKAGLYPPVLAEGAASLLPDGPRPAVIFHVRVAPDGGARLDGAERAIIHSTAKLAYDSVTDAQLPPSFAELSRRIVAAEDARGAARVDPPEQLVEPVPDDGYAIVFRPREESEDRNAAMSLACNMAVADALFAAHTGLFRVMPEPDDGAVSRLRRSANGLGLQWARDESLQAFERRLDPKDPRQAAFMMAVRRAGGGARYEPYKPGGKPWHAAMAATYAHATAPLRRLADRYVVQAALAVANGKPVPDTVSAAFGKLGEVMDRADAHAAQIDRAVLDLAEAVALQGREGQTFPAVVTDQDDRGARIQLADPAVITRVDAKGVEPGDQLRVKLVSADPATRTVTFERVA